MLTRARKGFTLLELIVVLVILGLLAAIAIPTYKAVIDKTKANKNRTTVGAIARDATALAAFDQQGFADGDATEDALRLGYLTTAAGEVSSATFTPSLFSGTVSATGAPSNTTLYEVAVGSETWCVAMPNNVNGASAVATSAGDCDAGTPVKF